MSDVEKIEKQLAVIIAQLDVIMKLLRERVLQ